MRIKSVSSPVLITGADGQTGYLAARSLSDLKVEIIGLYSNSKSVFCRSRYWNQLIHVKWGNFEEQLDALVHFGKRSSRRIVLLPSGDDMVQIVSRHRDELSKYYDFVYPDPETVSLLMDKTKFHAWAMSQHFPVPNSYIAASHEDIEKILSDINYPVVVKPMVRTPEWMKYCSGQKIFILRAKTELSKIDFDLVKAASRLIIQEWIPGGDGGVHFCLMYIDRNGRERGHYTGRKLLQWPRLTGNTAVGKGLFDKELYQLARDVLSSAGLRGLGSLEVKKSSVDNRYLITEPTVGRNNFQSYLAVAGGVNLTKMAYYDAIDHGNRIPAGGQKTAVWIEEFTTRRALKFASAHKLIEKTNDKSLFREIMCRRVVFANFNLKDPQLILHYVGGRLRSKLRQVADAWHFTRVFKYKVKINSGRSIVNIGRSLWQSFWRAFIDRKCILFYPAQPQPIHVIYKALLFLGFRTVSDPNQHYDVAIKWWRAPDGMPFGPSGKDVLAEFGRVPANARLLNIKCEDISKEHLNAVFDETFGYSVSVDPSMHKGKCVMKSNWNALHEGRTIECPTQVRDRNVVYQKLIRNETEDGLVEDMRVPVFGDRTPFVYLKYRSVKDRFVDRVHTNTKAKIAEVREVLSEEELKNIHRFCANIGMDYGEIDVLRDRTDGRIYIVDANNSPSGPPSPISYSEGKLAVMRLAQAFEEAFCG